MAELSAIAVRELSQGNRFYLPGIGYLSLSVGVPPSQKTNGKLTGKDICLRGINFRPEMTLLRKVRRQVSFVKSGFSTLSASYTAEELWKKVEVYLTAHRYTTRRILCMECGLSDYKAKKWLDMFVNEGKLAKDGTRHQPLYFLAASE